MAPGAKLEPSVIVDPRAIAELRTCIQEHERRINEAYFADLFLMIAQQERSNVTAEEIRTKTQEKMLQLGPVLERLNDELLDPLVDRVFGIMLRAGLIPPPPEQLQGEAIRVEYISILAQAQRLLGTTAVERLAGFVGGLSQQHPEVLDKLDWDRLIDDYAGMLGVNPDEVKSEEVVASVRAARAKQQQAAAQGQAMLAATQGARNLGQADMSGDSALARLAGNLGPGAAAVAPGGVEGGP
jgi:hypothetical protein